MAETNRKNIDLVALDYYDDKIKKYVDDKAGTGGLTIDTELSDTSENVPQTKIVKKAIDEKADKAVATTTTDGLMSAADKTKLDGTDGTYASKAKYGDTTINVGRKAETTVGDYSTAEGFDTTASGVSSHAEGDSTIAFSDCSHAEGSYTTASGHCSHAEGEYTTASGQYSHAEGYSSDKIVSVITDFSSSTSNDDIINAWNDVGYFSLAKGKASHSEGYDTLAIGSYSHAEGEDTIASSDCSHAEGYYTTASGDSSHAEGSLTTASGISSHAEGETTIASGISSHAEGCATTASGDCSHAEGDHTTASGVSSHAEGDSTIASGDSSHAEGLFTTASNFASHASGKFNVAMIDGGSKSNIIGTAFVIGNGTSSSTLSNAFSVQYDGTVKAKSTITASTTADYAEFFEWLDENPNGEDRVGYFVTLDGDKIRIANSDDDYILGVVSGEPFVLGNGDCDTWNGMFLRDEFRRTIYEPAPKVEEILDDEGNPTGEYAEVEGEYEGTRPKLNPEYDHTKKYTSRFDRKEWAPIGMLGVLAVRHDGTARVNGYVTVNSDGIATACEKNNTNAYRVIKSNSESVVEVVFK